MCFESKVNIWLSKHHIQHISVALGLFSILFSPPDQKQKPSRAGSAMETSRSTTGLLYFNSSNRSCAIPKSVSGSGYQKSIVCCLSIFSGVYLGNGRRCRYYVRLSSKSEDMLAYHILSRSQRIWRRTKFCFGAKKFLTVEREQTERERGNEREKK